MATIRERLHFRTLSMMFFCEEMFSLIQKNVEKLVLNGFSVFVSGGAWSGKSFFLRSTIDKPRAAGWSVFVVAPTRSLA